MADDEHWLKRNATPLITIFLIFVLAMFLRSYWAYGAAMPDRLYSGGSDSYYYEAILRYNYLTGHQLVQDPRLAYPIGLTNPRPPMFNYWSYLTGYVISPLFPDPWSAITYSFIESTAIFGALTIFPTYAIVKEAFNDRRAGLIAAFLLAVTPGAIGGSVASDGDHDSFVLFFVVVAFFFYLKSLVNLPEKRWVESWRKPSSVKSGLLQFFKDSRTSVLYSLMAGLSVGAVALAWQGWAYAPVILLVYFVFQLFFLRIKNKDTMGLTITFGLMLGLALVISAPWYVEMNQVKTWFDVPTYLFAAAMALGILFTVTRDYPWSLVVPTVLGFASVALGVGVLVNPALANAFVSGAGYFVQTKLYSTIAEAQAPPLSQIILSFGIGTYFLSWLVLGYLLWQFVSGRRTQTAYLFFVVWTVAAIFMAQSAARFIFNAAPAFAATAGFGIAYLLVKRFDFDALKRTYLSTAGGSRRAAIRKAVKPRHVAGALVIVFLLIVPNVWFAVDAAIPYEEKAAYDRQIYDLTPSFLRPPGYSSLTSGGSSFYLGAFGFSLPHPNEYYPSAWAWFATQDNQTPENLRPAYLSWWDYGFEAVDRGDHPTVADNFQNGYQIAGNFIAAQNESIAIALLSVRLIEGDFWAHGKSFSPPVASALAQFGISSQALLEAFRNPSGLVATVQANPQIYGYYDPVLEPANALYIYAQRLLASKLDANAQADLYRAIREATGDSIRYFAVDSRLFPSSASNTGIFYAPMKLSDRRIAVGRDGRIVPIDFFRIYVTVNGNKVALEKLGPYDRPASTTGTIEYQKGFYDSFFYRTYIGFAPSEVGAQNDGIPGISGTTAQSLVPLPGWGLSHWRVVYRTAYYNPYTDSGNHSSAWRAVNYEDALSLQQSISAGKAAGVVDLSTSAVVSQGVIFVKYYDDAYVNGTVTLPGGVPAPGLRVTVSDELGVPHYNTTTDAQGRYSVLVPAGKITITVSAGKIDPRTWIGATVLKTATITVTDDMAMRKPQGNGWLLTRNFVLTSGALTGRVFRDVNGNKVYDAGTDLPMAGATVKVENPDLHVTNTTTTDAKGLYALRDVPSGTTHYNVTWSGRTIALPSSSLAAGDNEEPLAVPTFSLSGRVHDESGAGIPGADVTVLDETNGTTLRASTEPSGNYSVTGLLTGNFTVSASSADLVSQPMVTHMGPSASTFNLTAYPSGTVTGTTYVGGNIQAYATMVFTNLANRSLVASVTSDATAHYRAILPQGRYSVTGRSYLGASLYAVLATVDVTRGATATYDAFFRDAVEVRGKAYVGPLSNGTQRADIVIRSPSGDLYLGRTSNTGAYLAYLPIGTYDLQATLGAAAYTNRLTFTASTELNIPLDIRQQYPGTVYRDVNGNGAADPGEGLAGMVLTATDPQGRTFTGLTGRGGAFDLSLNGSVAYAVQVSGRGFVPVTFGPATIPDLRSHSTIPLAPSAVSVTGTVTYQGSAVTSGPISLRFQGIGNGGVTTDALTDGAGRYAVSLVPGEYRIIVDQNVTLGSDALRWRNTGGDTLGIDVGAAPVVRDLAVLQTGHVTGTVMFSGVPVSTPVTFDGPDRAVVNTTQGAFHTYLALGLYTAYANRTQGSQTYIGVAGLGVAGATDVTLTLTLAAQVTGSITINGGSTTEPVTITFNRTQAGTFRALSGTSGTYRIALPAGDYSVTVDEHRTLTVGGIGRAYRIGFSGGLTVATGATSASFDVAATRDYDNSTVSGRVTYAGVGMPASITFSQRDTVAMNATATAGPDGTYSVPLLPGEYNVLAGSSAAPAGAFLGTLKVTQGVDPTLDLALSPAAWVAGVTTYKGGIRVSADVTFTATAAAHVTSDPSGNYRILLPFGAYSVTSRRSDSEHGMTVFYATTTNVTVAAKMDPFNLPLDRVVRRQVRLTWDASERQTIPPGGVVTYTVFVQNTGNVADSFTFVGSPTTWTFTFSPPQVRLDYGNAGNSTTVGVTIQTPPNALVNHGDVTIAAKSTTDSGVQGSATVQLDVLRRRGLSLAVSSAFPTFDGKDLNYTVTVSNKGNADENVTLAIPGAAQLAARGWVARFAPPSGGGLVTKLENLSVPGNSTRSVTVVLQSTGGSGGGTATVAAYASDLQSLQATQPLPLVLPQLSGGGRITTSGLNVVSDQGLPYPLLAVLITVVACITAAVVLTLRRRRR